MCIKDTRIQIPVLRYQRCKKQPPPKRVPLDLELVTIQDKDTETSYFVLTWQMTWPGCLWKPRETISLNKDERKAFWRST